MADGVVKTEIPALNLNFLINFAKFSLERPQQSLSR